MLAETTRLEEQLKKVLVATCEACLTQDTSRLTFFLSISFSVCRFQVNEAKIEELESKVEQEEVEKEKAWAAYTLLRKVVEKAEGEKAHEDSMALKEHQALERSRQEIEVMRQEVQRLQDKAMAAYEARDSTQREMLKMPEDRD